MWPFSSSGSSNNAGGSNAAAHSAPDTAFNGAAPAAHDPASYLSSHSFTNDSQYASSSSGNAAYTSTPAPSTSDIFSNPALQLDLAKLHPMAGLGKDDIEYLDIVDEQPSTMEGARTALPSRGWSDDLCYGTGTTYLSGLAIGGMLGAREGLTRPLGVNNPTTRLRLNAVLNSITRRGSFFGNSAGVIALIYNIIDASIDAARGKHDIYGAVAAGSISGVIFKSTAGPRAMLISSGIMAAAAATWTTAKKALV
ncbi:putative MAS6-mitochondrial inner membrane import translocase subunit [Tilletiaria anomala UBC 951]|uniref:Putative MAS6-mitochondrial inner membrane import translocase subunit n=1 Tax=Tilletiaria anomala (strain ATCC 24038 / CBS 436.72 / UBC 951) TaxID=1037660 RepID=A0A066WHV8_TILAU|nr:putative MAS6-mitochondrial inner membrane import translocase subunit [Tilletiaria anomala UBC 951]KDN53366.1 putative MAS6-mitochondrial inner membrane import translocase subunit [Tilletiaria anomala UBC 951]